MSTNLFDVDLSDTVTIPDDVDYVEQLVGEDKKFKTVKDLAKGKAESDQYIELLKARLDEANKELTTRTSLDSFLDKMKQGQQPAQQPQEPVAPQGGGSNGQLDDSSLEAKLAEILARREQQTKVETNVQQVERILSEKFGDQAAQVISHKAQELGMTRDRLKAIAAESPQAFLRLIGTSDTHSPQAPSVARSGVNTFATQSQSGVKNQSYFNKLKRENPTLYFDQKTTNEMIKARKELGDQFYK